MYRITPATPILSTCKENNVWFSSQLGLGSASYSALDKSVGSGLGSKDLSILACVLETLVPFQVCKNELVSHSIRRNKF